jgi:hypothetical protein
MGMETERTAEQGMNGACLADPTLPAICDIVRSKESAMLNWLVRLWHKIDGWAQGRQTLPNTYRPSNLHARRR